MHHRCAFCTLWEGGGVRELYGWAERFTESSEENQRGKILFCQCREETRNNWFLDVMQSSHMWKQAQWWLLVIHVQEYYEIGKVVSLDWFWPLWKNSENWFWFICTSHKNKAVFICKFMLCTVKYILFEKSIPSIDTFIYIITRYYTGRWTQKASSSSSECSALPLISSENCCKSRIMEVRMHAHIHTFFCLHNTCNTFKCFTLIVHSQLVYLAFNILYFLQCV